MAVDLDNITPADNIEDFDPKGADRGDKIEQEDDTPVDRGDTPVEKAAEKVEESAEEEDSVDEDEEEEEKPRNDKGQFEKKDAKIPKSRFDEAVGKEREAREAAERRAAELEKKLAESESVKEQNAAVAEIEASIEALEKKHAELLLDGDVENASKVMKDIRMAERQIARAETEATATKRTAQALESERVTTVVARLQADHPLLNEKSEEYNPKAVRYVLSEQQRLMAEEGLAPSVALEQAGKDAMELFAPKEVIKSEKDETLEAAAKKAEDRKAAQVKKNLDTDKKQPASLKDSGIDSDKAGQNGKLPDVSKMTEEEFNALPKSTLARLRGDLV